MSAAWSLTASRCPSSRPSPPVLDGADASEKSGVDEGLVADRKVPRAVLEIEREYPEGAQPA